LLKKWASELQGKRVLKTDLFEEAAENGDFLFWLLSQGAQAHGMDISFKITQMAVRNSQGHDFPFHYGVASDITRCAYRDNSFDVIISNSTLDNLRPEGVPAALKELKRILKPGGVLILTLDNALNPLYALGYAIEKILKSNRYYQGRCYTLKGAEKLAQENGFLIRDAAAIVHIPTPFNKIALMLSKLTRGRSGPASRCLINLFSKMGRRKTQFLTGWFIALKLEKKYESDLCRPIF
jgi:SAM-dependent methyltransferase